MQLSLGLLLLATVIVHGTDFVLPTVPSTGTELVYDKNLMGGILRAFMSPKGVNMTSLFQAFNPSPCLERCMPPLSQLLDSFSLVSRNADDTAKMCRQLASIDSCATSVNCDSTLLDLATKTYKFACVEKIEGIGESLKCAQDAFGRARSDCESGCIIERSSNSAAPAAAAAGMALDSLPVDVASVCESSVCLLGCMQKSINAACLSRSNGNNLFNAILTTTTASKDNTLSSLLSGMLPNHCRDVLKSQKSLSEKIAQLAGISKDSGPLSVGQVKGHSEEVEAVTTTTPIPTNKPTVTPKTAALVTTVTPTVTTTTVATHPIQWSPNPVEAPILIDGQSRTLQCQVLDYERQAVASPSIEQLARLIAQQLVQSNEMQMRADDSEADEKVNDRAFQRWIASQDARSYRELGFGAKTADSTLLPSLRANDQPSVYPSWTNVVLAAIFPFVIYLVD